MRTISEKEHKHQVIFNSLMGILILGLLCIILSLACIRIAAGVSSLSPPLMAIGVVLIIGSAVGLVLSYIYVGTPCENIWKRPVVLFSLGATLGGIIAYPLLGMFYWGFGIIFGLFGGLFIFVLIPSSKKISLPQEEIMNYFSGRIEEIKEGSYVPTCESVKNLPDFSEISMKTFRIAREQWYSQHINTSFLKYSKRLEIIKARGISPKEYDISQIKWSIVLLVVGLPLISIAGIGIILILIGIYKLIKHSKYLDNY